LGVPDPFFGVLAGVLGAVVGSFLNMLIWRLPRGESLISPGSHCPRCNYALRAYDNIPLLSFLILRGRCRGCGLPIPWRYFWVEALTCGVFVALFWRFGQTYHTVAYCLFAAALIAAFFIDAELFIIPDELNTFAFLVGVGHDVWGILTQDPQHMLLWGWLPRSLCGAVICSTLFVLIQVVGLLLFRRDAMGDGDVKLARAIGALLPISQALVSFLLAIGAGALIGGALMVWRASREKSQAGSREQGFENREQEPSDPSKRLSSSHSTAPVPKASDENPQEEEPEATPLPTALVTGAFYIAFVDMLIALGALLRIAPAVRLKQQLAPEIEEEEMDDFVAGPTHLPFGPYMVLGALLAVFIADPLIQWYLAWAGLAPK
jgi:leader peptidase (prepilin peptidase)/N-methyltransferase